MSAASHGFPVSLDVAYLLPGTVLASGKLEPVSWDPAGLPRVEGADVSPSMFSFRPALWVNGKEVCHRDADGRYDVRLTRAVIRSERRQLVDDPRVHLRRSGSDWVEVEADPSSPADQQLLFELVRRAVEAHQPPPGTPSRPPPSGPELERRRRFH